MAVDSRSLCSDPDDDDQQQGQPELIGMGVAKTDGFIYT
jgi:hypothetical protein